MHVLVPTEMTRNFFTNVKMIDETQEINDLNVKVIEEIKTFVILIY